MGSEQRVTKVTGERFVETEGVQSTSQAPWKQIASSVWQMFLRSALSPRGTPSPDTTMTPAANRLHVITVIVCSLNAFRRHLSGRKACVSFPYPCVYMRRILRRVIIYYPTPFITTTTVPNTHSPNLPTSSCPIPLTSGTRVHYLMRRFSWAATCPAWRVLSLVANAVSRYRAVISGNHLPRDS